ncbi:hypothetical protein [Nocardia terpenica]|uniref:Uncharacterized protein n=1 Tax=Nocardia terpenica TaxID=455432 RepID=A0A6G9Z117_9NOCA|nr:hypothetical protein [Nocardia terpenica]QIS19208.1 hypothetical protein F6W96_13820 [Nocardia terpenica]
MSYPVDQLPDLGPLGGHWTLVTVRDAAYGYLVRVGQAHLPGIEWPYQPHECPIDRGSWYLDDTLLICDGCGTDGT